MPKLTKKEKEAIEKVLDLGLVISHPDTSEILKNSSMYSEDYEVVEYNQLSGRPYKTIQGAYNYLNRE